VADVVRTGAELAREIEVMVSDDEPSHPVSSATTRHIASQVASATAHKVKPPLPPPRPPVKAQLREADREAVTPPAGIRRQCTAPPPGWVCTRAAGHLGPCAALPADQKKGE
jgi:hypothetical protein